MKLRLRDNTIRLRLTRPEVETMQTDGRVTSRVPFGGGVELEYCLERSEEARAATAEFDGSRLNVIVPAGDVSEWAATEQVSIAAEQPVGDGVSLKILVEKDFACLSPREDEDESDMFPHPLEGRDTC